MRDTGDFARRDKKNREAYMMSYMRRLFSGGYLFSEDSGVVGAFGDPWAEVSSLSTMALYLYSLPHTLHFQAGFYGFRPLRRVLFSDVFIILLGRKRQ